MPVNQYFLPHTQVNEQELIDDLVKEAIRIYGYEVMYIPRVYRSIDPIFNEGNVSSYEGAYPIAMYIRNIDGFGGDGTFLQKFGIEIRSQITFNVSIREFVDEVGFVLDKTRPEEGDLIYFPMDNKLFEIKLVDKYSVFYQTGSLQTYDLVCEVFEYSGEKLLTGIDAVDEIANVLSFSSETRALIDHDGNTIVDQNQRPILTSAVEDELDDYDQVSSSDELRDAMSGLLDLSEDDPFSESF